MILITPLYALNQTSPYSIPIICAEWAKEFPTLPPWPSFISRISASPVPYRRLLPDSGENPSEREEWTRALYWLLSHDLVIQTHDHFKVIVNQEIKEKARKEVYSEELLKRLEKEKELRRKASVSASMTTSLESLMLEGESREDGTGNDESDSQSVAISEDDFVEGKTEEEFFNDRLESFLHRPGRASSAENRCLQIIMAEKDEEWRRKFAM